MNVIEGIYSTIAYILVTFEAYVFLYNHDSNDILPLWPYFMYEIIVLVGKSHRIQWMNHENAAAGRGLHLALE